MQAREGHALETKAQNSLTSYADIPLLALASLNTTTPAFSSFRRAICVINRFAPSTMKRKLGVLLFSSLPVVVAGRPKKK